MHFNDFISNFTVQSINGSEYKCICPCHHDNQASLSIKDAGTKILIHCHAGCSTADILNAVGLSEADLFPEKSISQPGKEPWQQYVEKQIGKKIDKVYDYVDPDGNYIYSKIRFTPKDFRIGIIENGRFKFGLGGKERKKAKAFYTPDLPGFRQAVSRGETVYYAEGEKDVDTLFNHGMYAVTCGSSTDWSSGIHDLFKDANLIIFSDNDTQGQKLSTKIQNEVKHIARKASVVIPCTDIPKGDVSDYLENHTKQELMDLIMKDPIVKRSNTEEDRLLTEEEAIQLSLKNPPDLEEDNGRILKTFGNYAKIVSEDAFLEGKFRRNLLSGRNMVRNVYWNTVDHPIQDQDLFQVRKYISNVYGISNKEDIRQAIEITANNKSYHPIRDYLSTLEWDGVKRLGSLFPKYLGAERSDYTEAVTTLFINALIQRVEHPGCKFDYCLIIADHHQGTGKSSLCRMLALKDEWFSDSLRSINDNKRSFEEIQGRWVIELGEMVATKRAKDVETIKAYISRTFDDYRAPFATYTERFLRQCVFIGTSNKPDCLPNDKSGNRRFLPLFCDGTKAEVHPLEDENETREFIKQCFAEVIAMNKKEKIPLTLDEQYLDEVLQYQEQATPEDSRIGLIQEWLDNECRDDFVCTRMIWDSIFAGEFEKQPTKLDLTEIGEIMNLSIHGWSRYSGRDGTQDNHKKRFRKYGVQRAWVRDSTDQKELDRESRASQIGFFPENDTDHATNPFINDAKITEPEKGISSNETDSSGLLSLEDLIEQFHFPPDYL